jgi:hypothetical protein
MEFRPTVLLVYNLYIVTLSPTVLLVYSHYLVVMGFRLTVLIIINLISRYFYTEYDFSL